MSDKHRPPKDLRRRYNAGIQLVKDGMDPYLVLERVLWPSEAVEQASLGELPMGWYWTPDGQRENDKLGRQRARYWERKANG
jgi:hypothetical protein